MRILDYGRGTGKTYRCIEESLRTGHHILVGTKEQARFINAFYWLPFLEEKYSRKLPRVYIVDDLSNGGINKQDLIVDEAQVVLSCLLREQGACASLITLSADEINYKNLRSVI